MDNALSLLKQLIELPGLSGYEGPVQQRLQTEWEPLSDEVRASRVGSLYATKRGSGQEPRKRVMLAAHMDAIGLMVSQLVDGFMRIAPIGGIDARVLPGQPVVVHGQRELPGIVVQPPKHGLPDDQQRGPIPLEYLMVDVGVPDPGRWVRPGNLISFAQPPIVLDKETLKKLDKDVSRVEAKFKIGDISRDNYDSSISRLRRSIRIVEGGQERLKSLLRIAEKR